MKRRLLAAFLAVMLIASIGTVSAWADIYVTSVDREGPYSNDTVNTEKLPAGPDMTGDVINVNPANAQYTLDGAYGDINGKTINFTAGDYTEVLVLARPTKYMDSGTVYYNMNWTQETGWVRDENPVEFSGLYSAIRTYTRKLHDVTFTADQDVVLPGFTATSGHIYSRDGSEQYDYVIDTSINSTDNSYYGASSLVNVTFDGLTISGGIFINNYYPDDTAQNSGITISNCTFKGDETQMATNGFNAVKFMSDSRYFSDITVTDCTITDYFQGIYVQGADGWTIKNNTFENTTHNAIAIQSSTSNYAKGEVTIEENYISGAKDRAIRFGTVSDDLESVVIENNVMLNSGDSDGELFKTETLSEEIAALFSLEHNYWNGLSPEAAISNGNASVVPETSGIIGGMFTQDVSQYVDDDYNVVRNPDGSFTVVTAPEPVVPTPHAITITQPANGTVSTSLSNASKGAVITVTAKPNAGYELAYITVNGEKITGNTFVMPDEAVTVSAVFVTSSFPFTDVATSAWYYDAVNYVYTNGLMDGVSDTTFNPDGSMTRAMVWAILARLDGQTVTGANWATVARNWAVREGVSDGENANGLVTREQLATMIWRYVGEPASTYSLAAYTDANSVSDWASTAMAWAVENGIITGVTATTLVPQGTASRAQCAAILMRCVETA